MSNPYLDSDTTPEPQPRPISLFVGQPSMALVALVLAIAGLFMPTGPGGWNLPIPVPPFVAPKIDPAKTLGSWVVVIEQTEQRTPEQAKLLRDLPWWQSLEARGLKWRHYDYDAADAVAYRKLADDVGMPAVAIVGGQGELSGKVLTKFALPAKDALDAKIKEATGR